MKSVIIIPARFASTRFPAKALARLRGKDGITRTLIEHTWNAAQLATSADGVFVATDSTQIADAVREFGGKVLMTSEQCRNGTERCAQALEQLPASIELVVNLQGDAPLTPGHFIDNLIAAMGKEEAAGVATPVIRCGTPAKQRLINERRSGRVGGTTAVFDNRAHALYFSKEVIPFGVGEVFHHVGVYAYRRALLAQYTAWGEGKLEQSEGLEQMRFLENAQRILCVEVDPQGAEFWEVNNPQDIAVVEQMLAGDEYQLFNMYETNRRASEPWETTLQSNDRARRGLVAMTQERIEQTCAIAIDVNEDRMTVEEARNWLVKNAGMNSVSAMYYINGFVSMTKGKVYKRAMNATATSYFLNRIFERYGERVLKRALESVSKHINYRESSGGPLHSIRKIRDEFCKLLPPDR